MTHAQHVTLIRVRYSETDQMGTYYNSRALEWFECGRTELLRALGRPYRDMEEDGLFVPVLAAHVEYLGRARYDDGLKLTTRMSLCGRARIRFDVEVQQADSGEPVCRGYTIHAIADRSGKPVRPPKWLAALAAPAAR